jgi:hypothetical protein
MEGGEGIGKGKRNKAWDEKVSDLEVVRATRSSSPVPPVQAHKLMQSQQQSFSPLAPSQEAPQTTAALARLLADTHPRFGDVEQIDGMVHPTVMAGGWTITTRSGGSYPAEFGLYTSCAPFRRCVGCSSGCATERHLVELSRQTGGAPVLWLDIGEQRDRPFWMQMQVWMPSSPLLSGNWTPVWNWQKLRMELVSADAMTVALIEPGGSLAARMQVEPVPRLVWGTALMRDRWSSLLDQQERIVQPNDAIPGSSPDLTDVLEAI